ncbi:MULTISPECIES: response regulator transcription factor [unclassified Curtobacterium]|uniref:response regulator n=1 Tax=unclassified Curtobacterium TaxID=257496 RepID=UPI0008DCA017|nr:MULTISPECIES: response regulator transcription factor [unclassified Curtobacterium]OIH94025.1 DNA-binding response regulator [Curtobacterium sp. MCBA15_003]OII15934.1 DNA-binding response regulator [Curtobacterium sp. MCBA15_009]OII33464.1 DNA-binding response regulator [Curtobacterium sp. MMLR14_006]WIE65658.1 response regulator transcription factor [Curtobacterium sp. MCLR17_036]
MRVLLVDDHALVRGGLRAVLATTDDCEVVGEAATGEEAVDRAADLRPDVVVMDLSMPGAGGVDATARLRAAMPAVRVLVLTTFSDDHRVRAALAAGATGYLLKDAAPDDVVAAVRAAARDETPIDPRVARALLPGAAATDRGPDLPPRERDVLVRIARGLSNRQIATELGIAERTVKVHVGSLFRRIGVADRTSAALWARDHGW